MVHQLRQEDGACKITIWKEYWHFGGLTAQATPTGLI
jgi:hypothetical protein